MGKTNTIFLALLAAIAFPSVLFAQETCELRDEDGDKYFASSNPDEETRCDGALGVRGYEIEICDCPELQVGKECGTIGNTLTETQLSKLFDANVHQQLLKGRNFNPDMPDVPENLIDENCDGFDENHTSEGEIINFLFVYMPIFGVLITATCLIMLIGGFIFYVLAAGDKHSRKRATSMIIYSAIGLFIGLLFLVLRPLSCVTCYS